MANPTSLSQQDSPKILTSSTLNSQSMIAGQRVSVIKSILQKMLLTHQSQQQREKSLPGVGPADWSDEEIAAITDIFKTVVNNEIKLESNSHVSSQYSA